MDVPGRQPHGPGWFLISSNGRVEAGPFLGMGPAFVAAQWMEDHSRGVNPGPWRPVYSRIGLVVGSRYRVRGGPVVDTDRVDAYAD